MDHPRPGLRYVDAGDLDDSQVDFDGMQVKGIDNQKLGTVDGFIIDKSAVRPYYVVVNAGGWFKSKYFLLPVGHVGFDPTEKTLVADINHERVDRFPGFDRGEFAELSEDDLKMMDDQMYSVCCVDEPVEISSPTRYEHAHYRSPSWWDSSFYRPDRADTMAKETAGVRR
jgi:PRC-barrel domain